MHTQPTSRLGGFSSLKNIGVKLRTVYFAQMELVKLLVMLALLLTNVFCQEMDVDSWRESSREVRLTQLR